MTTHLDHDSLAVFLQSLSTDSSRHDELYKLDDGGWERFLKWAEAHRLQPILANTLNANALPASVAVQLKEAAAEAAGHNLALKGLSKTVLRAFEENRVRCLPFKGPELAEFLYGSASARACYDIDLVIQPDDYLVASETLISLGLRRDAPETHREGWHDYRYEECYIQPENNLFIELHWRFMPAFIPFHLTVPDVVSMTDATAFPPGTSYLPNHVILILLAAHGYRHYWRQLCWLTDIIRLIERGVDWSALTDVAAAFKVERITRLALSLAAKVAVVDTSECRIPPLPPAANGYIDAIIDSWRLLTDAGCQTDYRYIRTFLDTFYQRQVCLKRLTFQPTLADFDYIDLPPALRWLYPGVRFTRLVTRKREAD